ncbi:hypothetical protein V6Z11_D01G103000 [Gossypium hirsutum]
MYFLSGSSLSEHLREFPLQRLWPSHWSHGCFSAAVVHRCLKKKKTLSALVVWKYFVVFPRKYRTEHKSFLTKRKHKRNSKNLICFSSGDPFGDFRRENLGKTVPFFFKVK